MTDEDLCYLSIAELGRSYAAGRLSPVEVTTAYLRRIAALNSHVRVYTTLLADSALEEAKHSAARFANGEPLGFMDGIPIALKDLIDTAGVRTTANSPLYANRIPNTDATVAWRLRAAGAVLLGKLAMGEFAAGGQDPESPFPPARNPWNIQRIPGGSSSGPAAAVAAGLCAGALGSDTGGSIRGPAAYCGIVGLKPSAGLVSRFGVIPLSWTLDQVGPMTRTVMDTAILLESIAGYDPLDLASVPIAAPNYPSSLGQAIKGLRIGAPAGLLDAEPNVHQETMAAYQSALATLQELGAEVQTIDLPEVIECASDLFVVIAMCEAAAFHEQIAGARLGDYGRGFQKVLLQGALYSATDYLQAQRGRTKICRAMETVMRSVDLLALPTKSSPAPRPADEAQRPTWKRTTRVRRLFSLTGQPAVSIPCGISQQTLPLGLQLAGRLFEDQVVLAAAHAYEQATSWHSRRPPLGQLPDA